VPNGYVVRLPVNIFCTRWNTGIWLRKLPAGAAHGEVAGIVVFEQVFAPSVFQGLGVERQADGEFVCQGAIERQIPDSVIVRWRR
jgi:hypothetical protein